MSKATKIATIRHNLKENYGITVSEEQGARLYRVMEHDANMRGGVVLSLVCSLLMPLVYIITIPLAIAVLSHSKKIQNYEIDSLANYRIWSKLYLVLCTPLIFGGIVAIYLAAVTKPECYEEYESIYRKIHSAKPSHKKITSTSDDDDGGDFVL